MAKRPRKCRHLRPLLGAEKHLGNRPAAPAKKPDPAPPSVPSPAEFKEMLIRVHHYIKQNFEDVGSRFAEEAREIHNKKAEERPIHGTATALEAKELSEEGVPFIALPKPELDS